MVGPGNQVNASAAISKNGIRANGIIGRGRIEQLHPAEKIAGDQVRVPSENPPMWLDCAPPNRITPAY